MKTKRPVLTPFDRCRVPPKQNLFFMPAIWLLCKAITARSKLRINRVNMKGLKPPFLVLGTHHAFMDFIVSPLAVFPYRANYVSELEGFENYGEWLYRQAGCLGTRKFVNDIALIKNIKKVMERRGILVLYPEARYANVGTSSALPKSVGKLAKYLDVPLVTLNMRGNYLQSPIWNLAKRKEVLLDATVTQIYTREELKKASVDEINAKIAEFLSYDEYEYQYRTKMAIAYPKRAEGIEMPLYRCPDCGAEFEMHTSGEEIFCGKCGAKRIMTEYGRMVRPDGSEDSFSHIPDWYEWERDCVKKEIECGVYGLDMRVKIESLPNAVNFIDLGEGRLIHNENGFKLTFRDYGDTAEKTLSFAPLTMTSVHTEYNYRGKGQCVTLSTLDNTYFIYPIEKGFNATKIQFAAEYLYERCKAGLYVSK
ncbi:MAG: hypothetical protein HFJ89_02140 [Oscillospiraceae bacterium]|nr:hypothetical protein [Oscillospiraceae bacterium]